MSISLTCGPSGTVITGETEEELVSNVQEHAREQRDAAEADPAPGRPARRRSRWPGLLRN